MNRRPRVRARGATLIELLIASTLGLVVVAAVGGLFMTSSSAMRQDERVSFMNQELGYAIAQLVQDLEMAGHWARLHDPSRVDLHSNLSVAADCGPSSTAWAYADRTAISVVDNATGSTANGAYQCLPSADVKEGSDVIAIKRVLGSPAGTDTNMSGQTLGAVYLRTGNLGGRLYLHNGTTFGNVPPPFENWEYRPAVYYIQPTLDGTSEPALCRRVLRATGAGSAPAFTQECLAQGVENMQVELGIDTDADGAANFFWPPAPPTVPTALTANELSEVVAVRLFLLARSSRPDMNYSEPTAMAYQFSNMPAAHTPGTNSVDKHYYHKTLTSEIVLHNPRSLQGVAVQ